MDISMNYKMSKYNIVIAGEKNIKYLWNTLSGACIRIDEQGESYIEHFMGKDDGSEYFNILRKTQCIVPDKFDEVGKILATERAIMGNTEPQRLCFTIAPGLGCNYHCSYCFERNNLNGIVMNSEIEEGVYNYICKRISSNSNIKSFNISWFGGEPLLYIDVISRLSNRIIAFCDERKIRFRAGAVTNGLLLSECYIDELKKCSINHIQVSIDDSISHYCNRRGASKKNYYSVIDNIAKASNAFKVSVRINADYDISFVDLRETIDYLYKDMGLLGKVQIDLGFIKDCEMPYMTEKKYHGIHTDMLRRMREYIHEEYGDEGYKYKSPERKLSSCLQSCRANVCIGPQGELYRCEHCFGDANACIGDVYNGYYYNEADNKYYNISHSQKCINCNFLPICMEGCLNDRVNWKCIINCDKLKKNMVEMQRKILKNMEGSSC